MIKEYKDKRINCIFSNEPFSMEKHVKFQNARALMKHFNNMHNIGKNSTKNSLFHVFFII